jgi:hypothetical protein
MAKSSPKYQLADEIGKKSKQQIQLLDLKGLK